MKFADEIKVANQLSFQQGACPNALRGTVQPQSFHVGEEVREDSARRIWPNAAGFKGGIIEPGAKDSRWLLDAEKAN